jgi:hypothetical protein
MRVIDVSNGSTILREFPPRLCDSDMKHLGLIKADTWVKVVNWIGIPSILLFLICMVAVPWISSGLDWEYVQAIWDRWQTFNAAMLAFLSSWIAFNIAKFNALKQREREFVAARAFLPQALSELSQYFSACAKYLKAALDQCNESTDYKIGVQTSSPTPPENYRSIFSDCIRLAEPDVAEQLAAILRDLQIHLSRMKELGKQDQNSTLIIGSMNITSYMYSLGKLQVMVNCLFDFARGTSDFTAGKFGWEDFRNAYGVFDWHVEDIEGLESLTKGQIERGFYNR